MQVAESRQAYRHCEGGINAAETVPITRQLKFPEPYTKGSLEPAKTRRGPCRNADARKMIDNG